MSNKDNANSNKFYDMIISEEDCLVDLSLDSRDLFENSNNGNTDLNMIEISFFQKGRNGWGVGGGEYISTYDISSLAIGARAFMSKEANEFMYSCINDIIKIKFQRKIFDDCSFEISMLEFSERDRYKKAIQRNLSESRLQEYANVFYEWKKIPNHGKPSFIALS